MISKLTLRTVVLACVIWLVLLGGVMALLAQDGAPDARINAGIEIQGLAVYCVDDQGIAYIGGDPGSIRVLNANGILQLEVDEETIIATGNPPAVNTLLGSGNGLYLYLLSSGYFQLNGTDAEGKQWVYIFDPCHRGGWLYQLLPDGSYLLISGPGGSSPQGTSSGSSGAGTGVATGGSDGDDCVGPGNSCFGHANGNSNGNGNGNSNGNSNGNNN